MRDLRSALYMATALLLTGCVGDPSPGSDWAGRWVAINYWAEWCTPCLEEIPELNEFAAVNPDNSVVIGVNYDGASGEELERLVNKFGIGFDVIADPADRLGYRRPVVLPTTIIIDPRGEVVDTLLGPQTLESLQAAISQTN